MSARPRRNKSPAPPAPPPLQWTDTLQVVPIAPVSVPGGKTARDDVTPVAAMPTQEERLLWERVLRHQPSADGAYRPAPESPDGEPVDLCHSCDVDCCSGFQVPVNLHDVKRLKQALNLPARDFLAVVNGHPQLPVAQIPWGGERKALALRRRPDGSCAFLVRIGSRRLCGVHALRPDACRLFPFVANAQVQRAAGPERLLQLHPSHCPWKWPVTPERRESVLRDINDNGTHRVFDREVMAGFLPGDSPTEDELFGWLDRTLA